MARAWGVWTVSKLDLLSDYLAAFTTTTKNKSPARVYLDLFGGEPENVEKVTRNPIDGSARIALEVDDPPFTHLRFFEMPAKAAKLRATLEKEYRGRDTVVYAGDCNATIQEALDDLWVADVGWAPTFAFIDPNGPHYHWTTLEALAAHKGEHAKTKVELWVLFAAPLFARMLPIDGIIRFADEQAITAMYGTRDWHAIYLAKLGGEIEPKNAQAEYVNLVRWRLHEDLGYRWTYQLRVRNSTNHPIYYMIFATDSEPGRKIMRHLYQEAMVKFPQMAEENRQIKARMALEEQGQYDLFSTAGIHVPVTAPGAPETLPEDPPTEPREHDPSRCSLCDGSIWGLYEETDLDEEPLYLEE